MQKASPFHRTKLPTPFPHSLGQARHKAFLSLVCLTHSHTHWHARQTFPCTYTHDSVIDVSQSPFPTINSRRRHAPLHELFFAFFSQWFHCAQIQRSLLHCTDNTRKCVRTLCIVSIRRYVSVCSLTNRQRHFYVAHTVAVHEWHYE